MKIYLVGGAVRDEIMGAKSNDLDYSVVFTEAEQELIWQRNQEPFEFMANELTDLGYKIFLETPEHLTVRARFPSGDRYMKGQTADFVLARKEGSYTDGRRPDSVEPGTLEDDLARRDFTMNAIAKASDGTYVDPFNGRQDIADGIIRAVGDPIDRLGEDALRAVRAVRFAVTTGFNIEKNLDRALRTKFIIDAVADNIADERISVELSKMFRYDTVASISILNKYPALTAAMFSGKVSLDSTMKTKGRGK